MNDLKILDKTLSRRALLANTAIVGTTLGMTAMGIAPALSATPVANPCADNHYKMALDLFDLVNDPSTPETVRNRALTTASCPHCGSGLAPFNRSFSA